MTNATRVRDFLELFQPDLVPVPRVPTVRSPTQEEALFIDRARMSCAAMVEGLRLCPSSPAGLGARLMLEELGETLEAIQAGDLTQVADGLADLLYVVYWTAHVHGIPIDPIFEEVHRANMAKAPVCAACQGSGIAPKGPASLAIGGGPDVDCPICQGKGRIVTRDAGGKVVKPEGWTPPDIAGVLHRDKKPRIFLIGPSGCGKTSVHIRHRGLTDVIAEASLTHWPELGSAAADAQEAYAATPETVVRAVFGEWWKLPTNPVAELVDREDGKGPDLLPLLQFYLRDERPVPVDVREHPEHPDGVSVLFPGGYVVHVGDPVTQIVKLRPAQPPTVGETTLGPIFPVEPSR